MNPGLIPPADVSAAAKKGLELRDKFHRGGHWLGFIAQSSSRSVATYPFATLPRSAFISRATRSTRRRKATNGPTKPIPPRALSRCSCGAVSPAAAGRTV
jgi:hypothetical protein